MSINKSRDPSAVRQFRVGADYDGIRVDRWFKRHMPEVSFAIVSRWARPGQLRVDGARVGPGDRLAEGQTIRVPPLEPEATAGKTARPRPVLSDDQIAFAESLVIHRDAQALVINKPPGLATQGGTKTKDHVDGLLDALMYERDDRPRLVHRLDKDTSGALLLARTARSAAHFAKAFSSRTARKVYWALVMGVPSVADGMIDLPLAKQPGTGGEKMHVDEKEGSPSRTRYRVIERAGNRAAWVELQPFTGRTHQLRVHMAAIGHPIVGDGKYGGKDAFLSGTISRKMHLHARRIRIDHPDGSPLDVFAELPHHFRESMADLGFDLERGDLPLDEDLKPSGLQKKAIEKRAATARAKDARKARKGERRARGSTGSKAEPLRPGGKSAGRSGAPKGPAPKGLHHAAGVANDRPPMTTRLAIFDCDGTLVDSQHSIVAAMQGAFDGAGLALPDRAQILSIVGLSLPEAMARLLPEADVGFRAEMAERYKQAFFEMRTSGTLQEPLYDGMAALLDTLAAQGWLLAVATGKSDRGLSAVLAHHGLAEHFVSRQTADHHPSKPHPAMIEAALADTGVLPEQAVMIGDTSFDMLMARTAGVAALGVGWGYHPPEELLAAGARSVAMDSAELARHIGLS